MIEKKQQKSADKSVSLSPLKFEEAIADLAKVSPKKPNPRRKKGELAESDDDDSTPNGGN